MVRVAVVGTYPPPAEGISDYARHVVRALARRPEIERITVIANQTSADSDEECAPVALRRVWRASAPSFAARILREIARVRPDVIWYNVSLAMFGDSALALTGFLLPALTRRLGIRSIVTLHERPIDNLTELGAPGGFNRKLGIALAIRLLLGSDAVAVTIDHYRRALRAGRAFGPANVVYLPLCGYEEPTLEPFPETSAALMLTSHAPHKNLPLLIEAFERVRRRVPTARLAVAGIDHPRFPGYVAAARRAYRDRVGVDWLGPVPSGLVGETFRRATVAVAPYRLATGSSATVHRAVGLGRPVVVADLPEFRWMAEEEDLWLEFFPRDDATSLASVLERLLTDQRRCQEIAQHNYHSARRNSLRATADAYARLFQGLPVSSRTTVASGSVSGGLSPSTCRSP